MNKIINLRFLLVQCVFFATLAYGCTNTTGAALRGTVPLSSGVKMECGSLFKALQPMMRQALPESTWFELYASPQGTLPQFQGFVMASLNTLGFRLHLQEAAGINQVKTYQNASGRKVYLQVFNMQGTQYLGITGN